MENISNKETILHNLDQAHKNVAGYFGSLSAESFYLRPAGGGWSYAENLEHLIRSIKPIAQAMRLPKATLRLMFGDVKHLSRGYDQMKEAYLKELAKGAQASGRFLPNQKAAEQDLASAQAGLLEQWKKASTHLIEAIKKWNDPELDQYQLPHPILGSLTVREMLFFTIYHDQRHMTAEGD